MEKNMKINFEYLERRVSDALAKTDLEYIRRGLQKINEPTILSGVGGSSVVSEFGEKILNQKNEIITINVEPRDFLYRNTNGYKNVIACSYSGGNYGVDLSFNNNLNHYLLSNNSCDNSSVTCLTYITTIDKERSFISLGATLIPVSILLDYYLGGNDEIIPELIKEKKYSFDATTDVYEIFSGYDTKTSSKYLESTMVESGIGIPVVHDKCSYCHGRSTLSSKYNTIAIYFNRNTEFDKMILEELNNYYKGVIIIESQYKDLIIDDYQMLVQSMYLTKYIAEQKNRDLSNVEYSPIVKKLYKFKGEI